MSTRHKITRVTTGLPGNPRVRKLECTCGHIVGGATKDEAHWKFWAHYLAARWRMSGAHISWEPVRWRDDEDSRDGHVIFSTTRDGLWGYVYISTTVAHTWHIFADADESRPLATGSASNIQDGMKQIAGWLKTA